MKAAAVLLAALVSLVPAGAAAAERYALIVTGASGGSPYAERYMKWRIALADTLREKFAFPDDHLVQLAENESQGVGKSTRENVQRALADLRKRVGKDDLLLVVLIGHGTTVEEDAKFNLVGPDLTATEWGDLVKPIAGKVVFVDTSGGSYPFLKKLAGRGRVVVTATDSAAQTFETVFPEYFVKAFDDPAADFDKNGRVSIWEAFSYASAGVRTSFEEKNELPTERPLLDDTGAGIGREAQNPGTDGAVARVTYLAPEAAIPASSDSALSALLKRKAALESELDALKARKETMAPDQYDAELERILVELARVSQQIRTKS